MDSRPTPFERAAADAASGSLISEFWCFLCVSKKWWLLPVILVLLILALLTVMSGSAAAPFIYTLF